MKAVIYLYRFAAFFAVGLLFTACGAVKAVDVEPEGVLDPESSIVMALDFTNSGQVSDLKALIKSFPDEGLFDDLVAEYDAGVDEEWSYEKVIKPIIEKDWKIAMGMSFPEGEMTVDEFDKMPEEDFSVYIVGKFDKADEVEALLEHFWNDKMGEDMVREEDGDYVHWVNLKEKLYVSRYDDLFFLTNTAENRDAAIGRISSGKGFVLSGELKSEDMVKEDKLGYVVVNSDGLFDLLGSVYEEMGMGMVNEYLNLMGDIYLSVVVDDGGVSINSLAEVDEESDLIKAYLNDGLSLVEMIPGDGTIVFVEDPDFMNMFKSAMMTVSSLVAQGGAAYGAPVVEAVDYYDIAMDELTSLSSLSVEEIEALFSSHFAFSMSDVGTLYPELSLYLDIEDEVALDSAKAFNLALDSFADDVIEQFDVLMVELGVGEGLIKKDVDLLAGNGLHKVYADFSIFPDEILTQMEMFISDFDTFKVEFYYGILNDEVLIVALYPDLPEVYGKSSLADDELYVAGVEKLGDVVGNKISFVDPQPMMALFDRYIGMAALGFSDSDKEMFEKIKSYVKNVKYLISSSIVEDGLMKSSVYLKIGEK